MHGVFVLNDKKIKFSAQRSRKTRDFEKNGIQNMAQIPKLLGFSVPRP